MLKQAKTTGKMKSIICTPTREAVCLVAETTDSKGRMEEATYTVRCVTPTEDYVVQKISETGVLETYAVNMWNTTCECEGYNNGWYCRHLRMAAKLQEAKKIR
jgi:hypothetical protein